MKRVLTLALVLLFVGIVAFADMMAPAPKISLWSEGDMYADSTNGFGWGPSWAHMQNNAGGWYTTLNLSYDGKDYGYLAQLEFGSDLLASISTAGPYTLANGNIPVYLFRQFDAYYKLFDGQVKITGGKIMDSEYSISDFVEGDNVTWWMGSSADETYGSGGQNIWVGDFGGMIQFYPAPGFNFGIGASVPATNVDAYWGDKGGYWTNYAYALSVAAQYAIKDLVTVNGFFRDNGDIFDINIAYLGMKNLTLNAEIQQQFGTGANGTLQNFMWLGSIGFTMAPLTFGIMTGGDLWDYANAPVSNASGDWAVEAMVEYVLYQNISVGLKVGWENFNTTVPDGGFITGNVNGLELYPYLVAKFDNGSSVSVGFQWTSGINSAYVGEPTIAQSNYWGVPLKFTVAF